MPGKDQIGHNGGDEAQKTLFFSHLNTILAANKKLKAVQADYNGIRKEAKADGVILSDVDFAMRALETQNEDIVVKRIQRELQIAQWLNMPIGHQVNFEDADRRDTEEKAAHDGEFAGMRNVPMSENPHTADPARAIWLESWRKGNDAVKRVSAGEEAEGAEILKKARVTPTKNTKKGKPVDDPLKEQSDDKTPPDVPSPDPAAAPPPAA